MDLIKKKRRSGARLSRVENSMTVADWRIFYSVKFVVVVNVVVVLNSLHLLQLSFLFVNTQKPKNKKKIKKMIKKQKENK